MGAACCLPLPDYCCCRLSAVCCFQAHRAPNGGAQCVAMSAQLSPIAAPFLPFCTGHGLLPVRLSGPQPAWLSWGTGQPCKQPHQGCRGVAAGLASPGVQLPALGWQAQGCSCPPCWPARAPRLRRVAPGAGGSCCTMCRWQRGCCARRGHVLMARWTHPCNAAAQFPGRHSGGLLACAGARLWRASAGVVLVGPPMIFCIPVQFFSSCFALHKRCIASCMPARQTPRHVRSGRELAAWRLTQQARSMHSSIGPPLTYQALD